MQDPLNPAPSSSTPSPPPVESVEDQWKELAGSESLMLLNKENFDPSVSENAQMLVMFYAPCKFPLGVFCCTMCLVS